MRRYKALTNAYKYSLDAFARKISNAFESDWADMGDNILIDALGQVHGVAMSNHQSVLEGLPNPSTSQEGSIFLSLNIVNNIIRVFQHFIWTKFSPRNDLKCFELSGDIDYNCRIVPCNRYDF